MATKIKGRRDSQLKEKDPVCGGMVDPKKALIQEEQGKDYYFCSEECLQKFEENPSHYTAI